LLIEDFEVVRLALVGARRANHFDLGDDVSEPIEGTDNRTEADTATLEEEPEDIDNVIDSAHFEEGAVELRRFATLCHVGAAEPARASTQVDLARQQESLQFVKLGTLDRIEGHQLPLI